jgi:hypothetical protein
MKLKILTTFIFATLFFAVDAWAQGGAQSCATPPHVAPVLAGLDADPLDGEYCVTVYVEVDHDIVADKGPDGSRIYVEGLLSEVARLYGAQDITLGFVIHYWDEPSPYAGTSSGAMLDQFRTYRSQNGGHDGNVAMLISYQASGGIAFVDVLCRGSFGYAFSSITSNYLDYPEYNWSVEVIAHELGHNLGSPHTQSCVWNGNNTAIDACSPFGTEGGCDPPPMPANGGTVMSYCHLASGVGINFLKGFHEQPLALMKNRIAGANCVECTEGPDDPEPPACDANQVVIEIQLDNYAMETSWRVLDAGGMVVGSSPFYDKLQMNTYQADTLCLPAGCYAFEINDIDGLGGFGCGEGMYIVNTADGEVASGQNFAGRETTRFCLGNVEPPADDCIDVPLIDLVPYANQDRGGTVTAVAGGVMMNKNTWKAEAVEWINTPTSILTGQIWIQTLGEVHAIGLVDNITGLTPSNSFRLAGTQPWGVAADTLAPGRWEDFSIPVGQWAANTDYGWVVLINDNDTGPGNNGEILTSWRNVQLCESGVANLEKVARPQVQGTVEDEAVTEGIALRPFPNPVTDTLILPYPTLWHLFSVSGQEISAGFGKRVPMVLLPPGVYLLHDGTATHKIVKK